MNPTTRKRSSKKPAQIGRSKIFLSWSGTKSDDLAHALAVWFAAYGHQEMVFFSPHDLEKGKEWRGQLVAQLRESKVLIAFLTKENIGKSRWMECEATAVWLSDEDTLVFSVLVDLERSEIPKNSAWAGPFSEHSFISIDDEEQIKMMLREIAKACDIQWLTDARKPGFFTNAVQSLKTRWEKIKKRDTPVSQPNVLIAFKEDPQVFADWAYQYHRIIHNARDLIVHVQHQYDDIGDTSRLLESGLHHGTDPHPSMGKFRASIAKLLEIVKVVFTRLTEGTGAYIWVCLRDLRGDGRYHNFERKTEFPEGRDENKIPWDQSCETIESLLRTTAMRLANEATVPKRKVKESDERWLKSGRNCTIITDWTKVDWPRAKVGHHDLHRKESIIGAVLLKKVVDDIDTEPTQGALWWLLCVNSDKKGVFTQAH